MDLHTLCPDKLITAEKAVTKIKTGSRVFIGTGCGEPQRLIHAMVAAKDLYDILIYQMLSFTLAQYVLDQNFLNRFSLKLFFISRDMRKAAFEGKIDYIPAYLSQIPRMFHSKQIGLDVALEALRDCRSQRKCTNDELWQYAKVCRVANVMKPYLEATL